MKNLPRSSFALLTLVLALACLSVPAALASEPVAVASPSPGMRAKAGSGEMRLQDLWQESAEAKPDNARFSVRFSILQGLDGISLVRVSASSLTDQPLKLNLVLESDSDWGSKRSKLSQSLPLSARASRVVEFPLHFSPGYATSLALSAYEGDELATDSVEFEDSEEVARTSLELGGGHMPSSFIGVRVAALTSAELPGGTFSRGDGLFEELRLESGHLNSLPGDPLLLATSTALVWLAQPEDLGANAQVLTDMVRLGGTLILPEPSDPRFPSELVEALTGMPELPLTFAADAEATSAWLEAVITSLASPSERELPRLPGTGPGWRADELAYAIHERFKDDPDPLTFSYTLNDPMRQIAALGAHAVYPCGDGCLVVTAMSAAKLQETLHLEGSGADAFARLYRSQGSARFALLSDIADDSARRLNVVEAIIPSAAMVAIIGLLIFLLPGIGCFVYLRKRRPAAIFVACNVVSIGLLALVFLLAQVMRLSADDTHTLRIITPSAEGRALLDFQHYSYLHKGPSSSIPLKNLNRAYLDGRSNAQLNIRQSGGQSGASVEAESNWTGHRVRLIGALPQEERQEVPLIEVLSVSGSSITIRNASNQNLALVYVYTGSAMAGRDLNPLMFTNLGAGEKRTVSDMSQPETWDGEWENALDTALDDYSSVQVNAAFGLPRRLTSSQGYPVVRTRYRRLLAYAVAIPEYQDDLEPAFGDEMSGEELRILLCPLRLLNE